MLFRISMALLVCLMLWFFFSLSLSYSTVLIFTFYHNVINISSLIELHSDTYQLVFNKPNYISMSFSIILAKLVHVDVVNWIYVINVSSFGIKTMFVKSLKFIMISLKKIINLTDWYLDVFIIYNYLRETARTCHYLRLTFFNYFMTRKIIFYLQQINIKQTIEHAILYYVLGKYI